VTLALARALLACKARLGVLSRRERRSRLQHDVVAPSIAASIASMLRHSRSDRFRADMGRTLGLKTTATAAAAAAADPPSAAPSAAQQQQHQKEELCAEAEAALVSKLRRLLLGVHTQADADIAYKAAGGGRGSDSDEAGGYGGGDSDDDAASSDGGGNDDGRGEASVRVKSEPRVKREAPGPAAAPAAGGAYGPHHELVQGLYGHFGGADDADGRLDGGREGDVACGWVGAGAGGEGEGWWEGDEAEGDGREEGTAVWERDAGGGEYDDYEGDYGDEEEEEEEEEEGEDGAHVLVGAPLQPTGRHT
jgi:hypothetical protein